ncbi:alpha/beta hydrolase-fold protein [Clostridium sp. Marseille-Q2269]|uniref:alpha/beta hydrolase n=1 Tax=Clostridium sp. Marseille-Q2269 TaxID=2942205 RepID=UPI00207487EB|nr:alpha/beta hydrolase-fold protein [Clostridium sp. Marseille-Q2269]
MNKSKLEKITFYSNILDKEMGMLVYLPKEYNNFKSLPVLYFLHGRSGNENIMFQIDMNIKVDKLIKDREIQPMIIVCPRIENSRGINSSLMSKQVSHNGDGNRIINLGMYEDYFIKEIVPLIDNTFKTIKHKKGRYIGGVSAGGYIALHNAFRYQHIFSKVGAHMPALELELDDEDKLYYKDMSVWEKYDPIYIARNTNISSDMRVYLDAGDKDEGGFYKGCSILHKILNKKGVNCENHIFTGNHSAKYI